MGRQLPRQLRRRDPAIERLLVAGWPALDPELRKAAKNLAKIRYGSVCYAILVVCCLIQIIADSTPEQFIGALLSFGSALAVAGLIGALVILIVRAMRVAPYFVAAYGEMYPDHAERIAEIYDERGLGDVIAPWIRGNNNGLMRILRNVGKRFHIRP